MNTVSKMEKEIDFANGELSDSELLRKLAEWHESHISLGVSPDLRRIADEHELLQEEVSRLRDAYNGILSGQDICLSPIMAERERQANDLKEILIGYPNGAPGWQYMNGLIAIAKEKREAPSDERPPLEILNEYNEAKKLQSERDYYKELAEAAENYFDSIGAYEIADNPERAGVAKVAMQKYLAHWFRLKNNPPEGIKQIE